MFSPQSQRLFPLMRATCSNTGRVIKGWLKRGLCWVTPRSCLLKCPPTWYQSTATKVTGLPPGWPITGILINITYAKGLIPYELRQERNLLSTEETSHSLTLMGRMLLPVWLFALSSLLWLVYTTWGDQIV